MIDFIDPDRTILVVAHGGVEVDLLVPPSPRTQWDDDHTSWMTRLRAAGDPPAGPWDPPWLSEPQFHTAQTWKTMRCRCGQIHAAGAPAFFVLAVGRPPEDARYAPEALVVEIVPMGTSPGEGRAPRVIHDASRDFGPWAAGVIRNLTAGLVGNGYIGWAFEDLRTVIGRVPTWHHVHVKGRCTDAAQAILAHPRFDCTTPSLHLAFSHGVGVSVRGVESIVGCLADVISQDADLIFTSEIDPNLPSTKSSCGF